MRTWRLPADVDTDQLAPGATMKFGLDVMARQGNISHDMATVLKIAGRCRLNILIYGGTGSGKNTLLNDRYCRLETTPPSSFQEVLTSREKVESKNPKSHHHTALHNHHEVH